MYIFFQVQWKQQMGEPPATWTPFSPYSHRGLRTQGDEENTPKMLWRDERVWGRATAQADELPGTTHGPTGKRSCPGHQEGEAIYPHPSRGGGD